MAKPLKLDTTKFRKVRVLMERGSADGERDAARRKATDIAAKACISLDAAIREDDRLRKLEAAAPAAAREPSPAKAAASMFEEFFNSPEFRAERAEREAKNALKRAALLKEYGSEAAILAETEREALLSASVDHLKEWKYSVIPATGEPCRYVDKLDGCRDFHGVKSVPASVSNAVRQAYPYPNDLAGLLAEYKAWDKLYLDRNLFDNFEHWHCVEARNILIRHDLETKPVRSWPDMHARMDWWQVVLDWQTNMPIKYDQAFRNRVAADLIILQRQAPVSLAPVQNGRRTNADKAADVQALLRSNPELSKRAIGGRLGVSPQTVANWRAKLSAC